MKGHSGFSLCSRRIDLATSIRASEALQVKAVPVIELDAFLFQQVLLEDVAAIAEGE